LREGGPLIINNEKFNSRAEIIREKGTNRSAFADSVKTDKAYSAISLKLKSFPKNSPNSLYFLNFGPQTLNYGHSISSRHNIICHCLLDRSGHH
jgi:hypothetical protein